MSFSLKNNLILDNAAYIGWRNSAGNTVGAIKTDIEGNIFFNSLNGDIYLNHSSGGNIDFVYIDGVISASNLSLTNATTTNLLLTNITSTNNVASFATITNAVFTNIGTNLIISDNSFMTNGEFTNISSGTGNFSQFINVRNTANGNILSLYSEPGDNVSFIVNTSTGSSTGQGVIKQRLLWYSSSFDITVYRGTGITIGSVGFGINEEPDMLDLSPDRLYIRKNLNVENTINTNTISIGNLFSTNSTISNLNVIGNLTSNSGANFISCAGSLNLTNNTLSNINLGNSNAKILTNSADLIINGDCSFAGTIDTFTQNTSLFNNIAEASVLNNNTNFIQGYYGKNILYTSAGNAFLSSNYGNTFSTIPVATTGSVNLDLNAANYNFQYLLSTDSFDTNASLYRSSTYGNSWTNSVYNTNGSSIPYLSGSVLADSRISSLCLSGNGKYQLAAVHIVMLGSPTTFTTGMTLSTDYGSNFSLITVTSGNVISGTNGSFISCAADYTGKYMITLLGYISASNAQFLYVSNDFGTSWVETNLGEPNSLVSVDVSGTGQYMVALTYSSHSAAGLYLSSNFGTTWSLVTSFPGNANNVYISYSGQYILVPLISGSSGFYYSSDYGVTWTQNNSLITNFIYANLSKNGRNLLSLDFSSNIAYLITHSLNTSIIDFGAGISGNSRNTNAGQIFYNGTNLNIYGAGTSTRTVNILDNLNSVTFSANSSTLANSLFTNISSGTGNFSQFINVRNTANGNILSLYSEPGDNVSFIVNTSTGSSTGQGVIKQRLLWYSSSFDLTVYRGTGITIGSVGFGINGEPDMLDLSPDRLYIRKNLNVENTINTNTISIGNLFSTNSTISNLNVIGNLTSNSISSGTISATSSTISNSIFTNINSGTISSNVATIGNSITSTTANLFVNGVVSSNAIKSNQAGSLNSFGGGDIGFYYVAGGIIQFVNNGINTARLTSTGNFSTTTVSTNSVRIATTDGSSGIFLNTNSRIYSDTASTSSNLKLQALGGGGINIVSGGGITMSNTLFVTNQITSPFSVHLCYRGTPAFYSSTGTLQGAPVSASAYYYLRFSTIRSSSNFPESYQAQTNLNVPHTGIYFVQLTLVGVNGTFTLEPFISYNPNAPGSASAGNDLNNNLLIAIATQTNSCQISISGIVSLIAENTIIPGFFLNSASSFTASARSLFQVTLLQRTA